MCYLASRALVVSIWILAPDPELFLEPDLELGLDLDQDVDLDTNLKLALRKNV